MYTIARPGEFHRPPARFAPSPSSLECIARQTLYTRHGISRRDIVLDTRKNLIHYLKSVLLFEDLRRSPILEQR